MDALRRPHRPFRSISGKVRGRRVLDARWAPALLDATPPRWRRQVASRLLSLDARYAGASGPAGQAGASWEGLVRELLLPSLTAGMTVLELGCGPGHAASRTVRHVAAVAAVDTSRGALACARAVSPGPRVEYLTPEEFNRAGRTVDFAYSFTLTRDLPDDLLRGALETVRRALRPGGGLLVPLGPGGPAGAGAGADRTRLTSLALAAGLVDVGITAVRLSSAGPGSASGQPLLDVLTARRHAPAGSAGPAGRGPAGPSRDTPAEPTPTL
ncbi:class I SAM-dependent methyltransferase [Frankia sp. CiP1_Cm_nod2]|uniref:class I SAM-dependent methyltransferase n=1 Tax=Frankia sp. CiP1_Cm_nod2 TaxID=2897161 RepID=UPI0020255479